MHSSIRPHEYVALRLPSDVTKVIQLTPNTYAQFPFDVSIHDISAC